MWLHQHVMTIAISTDLKGEVARTRLRASGWQERK
jgi:hypothetical protein